MVYLTGDIHGDDSINKLAFGKFPEGRGLTRDDLVIVLGDFGLFWEDPVPRRDAYWLRWLEDRPWTTAFIDGNHENHDMLAALPDKQELGGTVGCDPRWPHVWHLRRGNVYETGDGIRLLALGGASSHDRQWRKEGRTWWPGELPDESDFDRARASLDAAGWEVDYVLTHDCPGSLKPKVLGGWEDMDEAERRASNDRLNDFLDEVDGRLSFSHWYFGHYHTDKAVDDRHSVLYYSVLPIGEVPSRETMRLSRHW